MYFILEQWTSICVKPWQLGRHYEQAIEDLLRQKVEGKCNGKYGYTIFVIRIVQREAGRIQDRTGNVIVHTKYQAILFKPFKDEVLDGVVTDVNKLGCFAQVGPLKVFVSRGAMPPAYQYQEIGTVPCFSDGHVPIKSQTDIRLKCLGVRYDQTGAFAVATINGDYLGPLVSDTDNS